MPPLLDEKILTSWNGLMISAMALGASILGEDKYREAARRAADFLLTKLQKGGRLQRTYRDGIAKYNAYVDDYAFLAEGLVDLYEASLEARWLEEAARLTDVSLTHYWDKKEGGFFFTSDDHEELLVRRKDHYDGAIPSGAAVAARTLVRLSKYFGKDTYRQRAEDLFKLYKAGADRAPLQFSALLLALDLYQSKSLEVAVVGPDAGVRAATMKEIWRRFLPDTTIISVSSEQAKALEKKLPLLAGKVPSDGKTLIYVCENFTCQRPIEDPAKTAFFLIPLPGLLGRLFLVR